MGGKGYNISQTKKYRYSEQTPSLELCSDWELPHQSQGISSALAPETCGLEINFPTPPCDLVGLSDILVTASMKFVGAGIKGMVRIVEPCHTGSECFFTPNPTTLGDNEIHFSDLKGPRCR
jgi:hypothetical protein